MGGGKCDPQVGEGFLKRIFVDPYTALNLLNAYYNVETIYVR